MTIAMCVLYALLGYSLGAIPSGVIVGRLWYGVAPHQTGSGHTGGLNVSRTTGNPLAGVLTGLLDLGLGILAVSLAQWWSPSPWAAPLAGVMAIWGHNYSVLIGLRGGVGISTIAGAMVALSPYAAASGLLVLGITWLVVRRVLRHDARGTLVVVLLLAPLMSFLRQPAPVLALAAFGSVPIALKALGDFHRVYPSGTAQRMT